MNFLEGGQAGRPFQLVALATCRRSIGIAGASAYGDLITVEAAALVENQEDLSNNSKLKGAHDRRFRAALAVSLVALFIALIIVVPILLLHEDGVLGFAHIGTRFSEGTPPAAGGTTGYDGQFAYFIARDGAAAVPFIDGPAFRYQRIVYPALARLLSLGIDSLVPWMLLLVNVSALVIGTGILAYLLSGLGAQPWYALIYALWIGNLFTLRFDLTEMVCYGFALAGALAYVYQRGVMTVLLLVLAALTKEIGLVAAAGIALHALTVRRQVQWSLLFVLVPVGVYLLWWGVLNLWLGDAPSDYPASRFGVYPFQGALSILETDTLRGGARMIHFGLVMLFLVVPAVILGASALVTLLRHAAGIVKSPTPSTATVQHFGLMLYLPAFGFLMFMPPVSWHDPAAVYRVGLPAVLAGILFVGQVRPGWLRWLAALWIPAILMLLLMPQFWTGGP
ncbi:MAG: hypothetical protein ACOCX5_04150 [Chloroflexota bacterium]